MEQTFFERLLFEEESATLDFKRDQYQFSGASDEQKSELLKDILGFANAFRREDAYILIGVEDVRGGKSDVVGVPHHLDDHSLQQFVNGKTNKTLRFHYEAVAAAGKQVGVIRIESDQPRPLFLLHDFGKLRKNEVYIRRGSSTDPTKPALPDEIALMGSSHVPVLQKGDVIVEFADARRNVSLGTSIDWSAELCQMPQLADIPKLVPGAMPTHPLGIDPSMFSFGMNELNSNFYREMANYERFRRLFREIRLVVSNCGTTAATDVRVEIEVPKNKGFGVLECEKIPQLPERTHSRIPAMRRGFLNDLRRSSPLPGHVAINDDEDRSLIEINCGSLQPGRKVWSSSLFVGVGTIGKAELMGKLFAANLSEPKDFVLSISATIVETGMSVDQLCDFADNEASEEDE